MKELDKINNVKRKPYTKRFKPAWIQTCPHRINTYLTSTSRIMFCLHELIMAVFMAVDIACLAFKLYQEKRKYHMDTWIQTHYKSYNKNIQ